MDSSKVCKLSPLALPMVCLMAVVSEMKTEKQLAIMLVSC